MSNNRSVGIKPKQEYKRVEKTIISEAPPKSGFNPVVRNKSEFLHNLRETVVTPTIVRREI